MLSLPRFLPGASFGEVELLRSDELSTPRLATCTCIGQPSGGDCEVLVVTEHMFDLLTDVFKGVRSGLDLQVYLQHVHGGILACGGVVFYL